MTVVVPSDALGKASVGRGTQAPNRFVSPDKGWWGGVQNLLANSRAVRAVRRAVFSRLPFPVLFSDVRDVVYANWIIPTERVAGLVPPGVTLHARDGRTILTVLTYRHGHFGPKLLGPLRKVCPSPLQSNWRLYLAEGEPARPSPTRTVLFIKNVFDSALYAIGTRLVSDSLPSHLAGRFVHRRRQGRHHIEIAGPGSAPTFRLEADEGEDRLLPPDLRDQFASWSEAVRFLCLQDGAFAAVDDIDGLAYAEIDLPIDIGAVQPLRAVEFRPGELLTQLGATGAPFCFKVPAVEFLVLSEKLVRRGV